MTSPADTQTAAEMHVNPSRAAQLNDALTSIKSRLQSASNGRPVRLVAVSKLHPTNSILALHQPPHSHLHFGENYVQELQSKASLLPKTIKWHFIGGLQSNKCGPLAQTPNLWVVSSVDTVKKADALERGRGKWIESLGTSSGEKDRDERKLNIHVQINTSSEPQKSGVAPTEASSLTSHILDKCPHLHLLGFMTIGALASTAPSSENNTTSNEPNPDFATLVRVRDEVTKELGLEPARLEVSMGMSGDFEEAVRMGSQEVRVGSTIFGERPPKAEAKIVEEEEGGDEADGEGDGKDRVSRQS
ncbi:MAG: hypothetical protein M1817_002924 [Caeruleum heppii]|nr:MAG: hypothetical protein M1817_002924 [Caeruleum heppii]